MLLKKKKYSDGDIVTIKIANGDEIVGKLVDEDEEYYNISKPMAVMPSQNGIMLVPSMFSLDMDKPVPISKKHVMVGPVESALPVAAHYTERTSTIATIPKGKIVI